MEFVIVGCGAVGSGLARTLSMQGHGVTAVDKDPAAFERLGPSFKGQTVDGVGFDRDVLIRAGIKRADGLAAVTASDETNAVVGRIAQQVFHVPRVVARLYDPRKAEIYQRLGLQTIAPVAWGIHRIAELLSYSQLDTVHSVGTGGVELVDTVVPPLLVGRMVKELSVPGEVQVVGITRGSGTFLPTLGAVFQDADMIHLAMAATSSGRVRSLLGLD
jgi:trk system potassium uptake protein TrkA